MRSGSLATLREKLSDVISEDRVADYHRDGAVLLKGVLGSEELRLLEQGVDEAYADPGPRSSIVRNPDGTGETLVETSPSDRSPALRRLRDGGRLAEIAGLVMQVPSAQLIFEQIFYKTSGGIVPTPWHQDTPFLRVRGYDMCRVWLSADPSPADITVQVVRGSHRWNVVYGTGTGETDMIVKSEDSPHHNHKNVGDPNLPRTPDVARFRGSFDILSFDVEPGDALVFQGNMLHGASGRDHWDRPRRAFATMWGGPEIRYHKPEGKSFPPPGNLRDNPIENGARIGDHPAVFPFGWRADEAR